MYLNTALSSLQQQKKIISIFTTEPEKVGRSEKGKTFFPYRVEGNLITVDINL